MFDRTLLPKFILFNLKTVKRNKKTNLLAKLELVIYWQLLKRTFLSQYKSRIFKTLAFQ